MAGAAGAQSYLAKARVVGGNPGPAHNYVCPNADGGPALECFLDAVRHLYTMCKHVKSIEIIEFGYERSDEGTNTTKSEYCIDKQKVNIARPFQAALREAKVSRQAIEGLQSLHGYWLDALASLKYRDGESTEDYLVRTGMVYPSLDEQIDNIRSVVLEVKERVATSRGKAIR